MAYGNNFQLAKEKAQQILSFYSPNAEFCVLPLCTVTERDDSKEAFWTTKNSALELIKKIELSYMSCSIREVLIHIPHEKATYPTEYIYIGDGQEINFKDFAAEHTQDIPFYWLKIPTGSNVSITDVALKDPIAVPFDNYDLHVIITNSSQRLWTGVVGLHAQDYSVEKTCEVQPNRNALVAFVLPVSIRRGTVEIYDDSLSIDNIYYFSKIVPRKLNVLIVGNDEFLRTGLNPAHALRVPFSLETVQNISTVDLRKFHVVLLNGLVDISESDKIRLTHFLNRGETGIIYFMGPQVGDHLTHFIQQCCIIESQVSPQGYVTIDWIDYEHPVFSIFRGTTALKNIKFYHFYNLVADHGVIAQLSGNYPLIVSRKNLAVVATQFTPRTTDIMYKTAFVPLLYRLIGSLVYRIHDRESSIGMRTQTLTRIKAPTGEYLKPQSEFLIPGFYTTDNETLGVSVDPNEGNLSVLGDERAKILRIHSIDVEKDLGGGDITNMLLFLALFVVMLELALLVLP